jgi:hypothetical protein
VLVPGREQALIDQAKLQDYLLSTEHPIGRFKARFVAALGFSASSWSLFEHALREQHLTQKAEAGPVDPLGQTFVVRAILRGPAGVEAPVVSVWFVRKGEAFPRFVTAYPGGSK